MLQDKKVILGVCGSIAAYKAAFLVRLLTKQGAEVQVVMTNSASGFITPLTLATLSQKPVFSHLIKNELGQWNNHVELGLWADLILIAPASANSIAKMANGLCDNLLTAVYLSARCPVYIAPAMDLDMYAHKSTRHNIEKLKSYGNHIIDAEHGELASGLKGKGRMAEPENIIKFLNQEITPSKQKTLAGKKILITAGPTYEKIDPVRFIGNHSSGKMGFHLAEKAAKQGARVTLVAGPTHLQPRHKNINLISVGSAEEMYVKAAKFYKQTDVAIFAAAVADYKPGHVAEQKIKKQNGNMTITLIETVDIAKELGKLKKPGQYNIGFALETENEQQNAKEKIKSKNFDLIVLNTLNDEGAGFGHDTNKISIIDKQNKIRQFELKSKAEVAGDIIEAISELINA